MRYVEFSPYWNVPRAIQRGEIVPRLARDPDYWEREDLEAVPIDGNGAAITTLDAATLQGLEAGTLRVRQRPGAKNALGGVKISLPTTWIFTCTARPRSSSSSRHGVISAMAVFASPTRRH